MRLRGEIKSVDTLSRDEKNRMFQLMNIYFYGVTKDNFNKDLQEKDWVIVLYDNLAGQIQGFSTLMFMQETVCGIPIKAVFSGDTIINKDYWGETTLAKIWLEFIYSLKQKYGDTKLFWFLITMGYKTYRYLPVYCKKFYPHCDEETPEFEKRVLDALAFKKFGLAYNSKSGIIHFDKPRERLKPNVADIDQARLKNKHIDFFVRKNPFYASGDELACISELSEENIKSRFLLNSRQKVVRKSEDLE